MAAELTAAETVQLLNSKAKELGDTFRVKVFRQRTQAALPEAILTMDEATVGHIASPETWLPRLVGGGPWFTLWASHMSDPTLSIGSKLTIQINGDPKNLDFAALKDPAWNGPSILRFPAMPTHTNPAPMYAVGSGQPSAPSNGAPSAGSQLPSNAQLGGSILSDERVMATLRELNAQKEGLAKTEREFNEKIRRMELESAESRHQAQMAELRAEMSKIAAAATRAPEPPNAGLANIVAAVTPLIAPLIQASNEFKMMMMKAEEARAAQQQALLTSLLSRPAIDPALQAILERNRETGSDKGEIFATYADTVSNLTRNQMEMLQTMAEMQGGEKENPVLTAVREASKGVMAMMAGYQAEAAKNKRPAQARRALPPPAPVAPANIPHNRAAPPQRPASAQALSPTQVPMMATQQAQQNGSNSFADYVPPQVPEGPSVLSRLDEAIANHEDPVEVTKIFFFGLRDEDDSTIRDALAEVEGEVEEFVGRRYKVWIEADPANLVYVRTLLATAKRLAREAGIVDDEEDGEEETDAAAQEDTQQESAEASE